MSAATATEILRQEHEAILRMLDGTQTVVRLLEKGVCVPPETLEGMLEFFRVFADRCHHAKEEDLLFPLLLRKGLPAGHGPIAVMLAEHEQGRALVAQMAEAARDYRSGSTEAGRRWAAAARRYVDLLDHHISKENNVLFPLADGLLCEGDQHALALAFERAEKEKLGPGAHERLHALLDRLTKDILALNAASACADAAD